MDKSKSVFLDKTKSLIFLLSSILVSYVSITNSYHPHILINIHLDNFINDSTKHYKLKKFIWNLFMNIINIIYIYLSYELIKKYDEKSFKLRLFLYLLLPIITNMYFGEHLFVEIKYAILVFGFMISHIYLNKLTQDYSDGIVIFAFLMMTVSMLVEMKKEPDKNVLYKHLLYNSLPYLFIIFLSSICFAKHSSNLLGWLFFIGFLLRFFIVCTITLIIAFNDMYESVYENKIYPDKHVSYELKMFELMFRACIIIKMIPYLMPTLS